MAGRGAGPTPLGRPWARLGLPDLMWKTPAALKGCCEARKKKEEKARLKPLWCPALTQRSENKLCCSFCKPESTAQVQGVVTLELVATLEECAGDAWVRVPFWRCWEFWFGHPCIVSPRYINRRIPFTDMATFALATLPPKRILQKP